MLKLSVMGGRLTRNNRVIIFEMEIANSVNRNFYIKNLFNLLIFQFSYGKSR